MISKPHRQNSDFQLRYFIAGSCKTPDAAYCILYSQMIDVESKVKNSESQEIDREIRKLKADRLLQSDDALSKLEGKKELLDLESSKYIWDMNILAARAELKCIKDLMAELEPMRKYAHLSILDASEACQREEWLLELKTRVENSLLSIGSIPADQLDTMRMHPDFHTEIAPHILGFSETMRVTGAAIMADIKPTYLLGK